MSRPARNLRANAQSTNAQSANAQSSWADDQQQDKVDMAALEQFLGYPLRRAQLVAFQEYARAVGPHAIPPAQFSVLTVAAANPGISQITLAGALAIEPSRMVALLDALERRGFATRAPSKTDRRSHGISLTRKGLAALAPLTVAAEESNRRVTARLSAKERETLAALLRRLY
jgi:DNA-binding MarR family transcriptional regulator